MTSLLGDDYQESEGKTRQQNEYKSSAIDWSTFNNKWCLKISNLCIQIFSQSHNSIMIYSRGDFLEEISFTSLAKIPNEPIS